MLLMQTSFRTFVPNTKGEVISSEHFVCLLSAQWQNTWCLPSVFSGGVSKFPRPGREVSGYLGQMSADGGSSSCSVRDDSYGVLPCSGVRSGSWYLCGNFQALQCPRTTLSHLCSEFCQSVLSIKVWTGYRKILFCEFLVATICEVFGVFRSSVLCTGTGDVRLPALQLCR